MENIPYTYTAVLYEGPLDGKEIPLMAVPRRYAFRTKGGRAIYEMHWLGRDEAGYYFVRFDPDGQPSNVRYPEIDVPS